MECSLCNTKLKRTRYYIDYHISKNTLSWESISGLVENNELIVCKKCAINYRNIMARIFGEIGIKNWLKTVSYIKKTIKFSLKLEAQKDGME